MISVILIVDLRVLIKVLVIYYENFITLTLMLSCFYLPHFVPLLWLRTVEMPEECSKVLRDFSVGIVPCSFKVN